MLKNTSNITRMIVRLAIPLATVGLILAPLLARRSSDHFWYLGVPSAMADESHASTSLRASSETASITIDYPQDGSIFPPDILPPTFIWRDADASAKSWRIAVTFADGSKPIHFTSHGDSIQIGKMDPRGAAEKNEPPMFSPKKDTANSWIPDTNIWAIIKQNSAEHPATKEITGVT